MTTEQFIEKAKKVHGDKYDFSKSIYKGSHAKVCVICPKHGEFWMTATNILSGKGCRRCAAEKRTKSRTKTTEQFIKEAKKIYGDKYDYSKVKYVNAKTKVTIIDRNYGEFLVTPDKHLQGQGFNLNCSKMKDKVKSFVEKAKQIHGDKYDYSKLKKITEKSKIVLSCPIHGDFEIKPHSHLEGKGCPICRKNDENEKAANDVNIKKSVSEKIIASSYLIEKSIKYATFFLKKAKEVHGDTYDYSLSFCLNSHDKIPIICKKHGIFYQSPNAHLSGKGCKKCAGKGLSNKERIEAFVSVHGDKYDYSKVNYVNAITNVCIICPEHGEFWISPNKHLIGRGCPICSKSMLEKNLKEILDKANIEYVTQKEFEWLKYNGRQRLDFYLPKYNTAIECQGNQHIEGNKYYFGYENVKEAFALNLKRDLSKHRKCEENGIKLFYLFDKRVKKENIIFNDTYEGMYTKYNFFNNQEEIIKAITSS